MELVYAEALRQLKAQQSRSEQQLREAINTALGREAERSWDLVVLQIEQGTNPTWFVGFSCFLTVSRAYSTFRIFKARDGQYQQVVTSAAFPALKISDRLDMPIDHATLEAKLLRSQASKGRTYILTDWVRAGMSPAPGSLFLWEWDGQQLRLVWQLIGFEYGTVEVVDQLLLLNRPDVPPEKLDLTTVREAKRYVEVYRLQDGNLVKDGLLSRDSAERYLREGLISASDPDSVMRLAAMLDTIGDKRGAIWAYEEVIRLDSKRPLPYMALSLLYEALGQFGKAAEYMQQLAPVAGGLNAEGERRLQELQRKAKQQRQP